MGASGSKVAAGYAVVDTIWAEGDANAKSAFSLNRAVSKQTGHPVSLFVARKSRTQQENDVDLKVLGKAVQVRNASSSVLPFRKHS